MTRTCEDRHAPKGSLEECLVAHRIILPISRGVQSASVRVEGSAPNVGRGSHEAVELLPLNLSTKTVDANVAVHPKRARAIDDDSVPIEEDQDGQSG